MIVETQKLYDEIASLRQQLADIKEELQYVLNDWNALVRAIGAKKNGTAIGEAHLLVKQLAEAQERLKWQPIETAPKDGEQILISVRGNSFLAYWHTLIQAWDTAYGSTMEPAHWMPLPPAPEADNAG